VLQGCFRRWSGVLRRHARKGSAALS
jgi:hypothetical protein